MEFSIEYEREEDGRWLAEVPQLPGVLAYGSSPEEAMARVEILALRVLAEQLEQGEAKPLTMMYGCTADAPLEHGEQRHLESRLDFE